MTKELQEGDIVLCTVTGIENTAVFVTLTDGKQGTIMTAEIAPGRIRNIREYVVPNKKIACKVLRISQNHIDLSLRRVTAKEKAEIMEIYKQEQTVNSILKSILKEKASETEEKILQKFSTLAEFFAKAREDEKILSVYFEKDTIDQFRRVLQKRTKEVEAKKIIKLKCLASDGIKKIRSLFQTKQNVEIIYLAAGTFQASVKDTDYKKANQRMSDFLQEVETKAKKDFSELSIEDKK